MLAPSWEQQHRRRTFDIPAKPALAILLSLWQAKPHEPDLEEPGKMREKDAGKVRFGLLWNFLPGRK